MRFLYLFILLINVELIVFQRLNNNLFLLVIIIPIIVGFLIEKIKWKQWLLIFFTTLFIFFWCWFYPSYFTIENLNHYLEAKVNFYYVKQQLINYVNFFINDKNIAYFTNYLLFNYINNNFQNFINQINNMGISHLFVISGMHINLILNIWEKITKKWCPFWLTCLIRILLCLWFCYCLSFSSSTIRVLIQSCFKCNKKINSQLNLGYSGILHAFLLNNQVLKYGFLFSYGCTLLNIVINNTKIRYQIVKSYLVNITCYLFTLPLIIQMSHQINFCSIVFNIILSPCIVVIFSLTISMMLIPYAYYVLYLPIYGFMILVSFLNKLNIIISIKLISQYIIICYYFLINMVSILIFLLKNKSKKIFFTYNEYIELN